MKTNVTLAAIFTISVLFLSACASSGPVGYGPAYDNKFGYSETKLEKARYRITYKGSAGAGADNIELLAIRRAAELTVQDGYEWFQVINREVTGQDRGGVSVGGGVGSGRFGRRSSVGIGVGGNFGTIGAKVFYTARIEIIMGNYPHPDSTVSAPGNGINIYDANSFLENTILNSPVSIQQ